MLSGQMENVEVEIIRRVYASGAFLSLLGSCFIIVTFLLNRKLRTTTTFLVFLLAVASLGHALFVSLSWFLYDGMLPFTKDISDGVKEILCVIQASGIQYFALSSFLWTSTLAFHAFNILCRKKHEETLHDYLKYYILICTGVPIVPLVICLLTESFGQTEDAVWCWIEAEEGELRFGVYYVPLVVLWMFNVIMYVLLSRERRSSLSYEYIIKAGKRRLRLYILVFILCKLPSLVNRLANAIHPEKNFFILFLIQAIFDSLFGFFEALVYLHLMRKRITFCCWGQTPRDPFTPGADEPMLHRDLQSSFYSSIAERLYYKQNRSPIFVNT